jgi:hypothetical protein
MNEFRADLSPLGCAGICLVAIGDRLKLSIFE